MLSVNKKAIGILGGTFDPIHVGHLRMALELYELCALTRIKFIPCHQPVHRDVPIAQPEDRLAMVQAAISAESYFECDAREIQRKTPSYTIDTLIELRNEFPHTPLCLLIGIDAFLGFTSWRRYQDILKLAHVIIAHRPQYELPAQGAIKNLLELHLQENINYIHEHMAGGIILKPITLLNISATDIRKQIAIKRNPRYLLPDKVLSYIYEHNIYNILRK